MKQKTEFELNKDNAEEETAAFEAMGKALIRNVSDADAISASAPIVKQEPTDGDVMAENIETSKAHKDQVLTRMRTMNLEVRQMSARTKAKQLSTGTEAHMFLIGECGGIEKTTSKSGSGFGEDVHRGRGCCH